MGAFATFAAVLASVLLGMPPGEPGPMKRYEFVQSHMGSDFKILLYSPDEPTARRASQAAFERIKALDQVFSDYNPESELMKLCDRAGGPEVAVSDDLLDILVRSKAMHKTSQGAFDITAAPVIRLWRRARRERKLPSPESIAHARSLVSSDRLNINVEKKKVRLEAKGMKLDLGAIAKGYASQAAIDVLKREGIASALVAGAGDIVVSNAPPGETGWAIGIAPLENPESAPDRILSLHNTAISTSGDTERYVEIDGKRYSHIVDTKTGLGKIDRASVTVIAPDGATADALDTAVYALGPEKGLPLVEATPGAAAYIVRKTDDGLKVFESQRFPNLPRAESEKAKLKAIAVPKS